MMLTVVDLCSGIGGFSLGLERTGGFKHASAAVAHRGAVGTGDLASNQTKTVSLYLR